jgi:hypothetical protein
MKIDYTNLIEGLERIKNSYLSDKILEEEKAIAIMWAEWLDEHIKILKSNQLVDS